MSTTFASALLTHYDVHSRDLPWRGTQNAYAIWLSEIMLQQTTVATVKDYYTRFLHAYPTVFDLAGATEQEVLTLWQGLGYYSRARNLHACAKKVAHELGGHFPATPEALQQLPGIGPYTAAAIAAIAFGYPATVVDGNVERVISRLYRIEEPLPKAKPRIRTLAAALTPQQRAGDYAGAIMDLGATICTPRKPACTTCPVASFCASGGKADAVNFPRKMPKKEKPFKTGTAWCLWDAEGRLYLRQRPPQGLLASLWEVPTHGWEVAPLDPVIDPLLEADWQDCGTIKHVFTHFTLTLTVKRLKLAEEHVDWVAPRQLKTHPLPTLMRKVLDAAATEGSLV
ncbi:MAG: A/G-specific adenine glycosylase [Proteobacteria bacterium]|nr:A/G-specific adenine glycosylase [Pseudomonadota bacterium]